MNTPQMHSLVISEDKIFAQQIKEFFSPKIPVYLVKDFSTNGIPFIYIFNTYVPYANHEKVHSELHPFTRKHTLATGRVPADAPIPINLPSGTVLLPWCSDDLFLHWVAMVGAFACFPARVYPHYFFLKSGVSEDTFKKYRLLFQILEGIAQWPQHQISVTNMAGQIGMTERQLRKLFPKFFGVKPGQVLRAMELFKHTAILMQEENRIHMHGDSRHGNSPLAKYELETNCNFSERLKRLLGLEYRELLASAQKEHWASLWMRKWRETMANTSKVERPQSRESINNPPLKRPQGGVTDDVTKSKLDFFEASLLKTIMDETTNHT